MIIPPTITVSELHSNYLAILTGLGDAPVIVQRRSKPIAVLVAIDAWNNLQRKLQEYEKGGNNHDADA